MGECSFDKRAFEFPLEYIMTVASKVRSSRKLCHRGNQYVLFQSNCSLIYIPSSFWLWTRCILLLLSITMFSSGNSRVLCLVPTVMQVVLS